LSEARVSHLLHFQRRCLAGHLDDARISGIFSTSKPRAESVPKQTRDWIFLQADGVSAEHQQRFRLQVTSDVYRAMQTRLDGYRQSAAAIFLGVVAGLLTLDASLASSFGRIITGAEQIKADHVALVEFRIGCIILTSAVVLILAGIFVQYLIARINHYFAEMSGVVYQFDLANKLFEPDAWLSGRTVYPQKFKTEKEMVINGETWLVWYDPSIRMFLAVVRIIFSLNVAILLAVGLYLLRGTIAGWY
jgi:hypothetical protein